MTLIGQNTLNGDPFTTNSPHRFLYVSFESLATVHFARLDRTFCDCLLFIEHLNNDVCSKHGVFLEGGSEVFKSLLPKHKSPLSPEAVHNPLLSITYK